MTPNPKQLLPSPSLSRPTGPICIAGSSRRTRYRAFDIIGRHASHSLNLAIDGFEPLFRKGHPNGDNTILELCLGG